MPFDCFEALKETEAWTALMLNWKWQAEINIKDREAFRRLIRPNS